MDNQKVLAQVLKNLSDRWEMTVSEVAEKLNKMSEDEVKNVLEMTKLFEKGGKLNYLLCLKNGGVADCGCGKKLKAQNGQMMPTPDYQNPYSLVGNDFIPLSESAPMTEEEYNAIESRPPGLPRGWMRQNRRENRRLTRQARREAREERRENRGWDFGSEGGDETMMFRNSGKLRSRGTKPATSGIFQPKFDPENDPNWFRHNGAWVRNHFLGDDLTQFVVTDGYWGVPRKSWREIKNYNDLQRADTLNFDANGSSKNSREFIDRQNAILRGAEPQATSGAEARILNRQNGGEIQEPLPDLRYRENEVWVNDGSVDGMRHRIGNLRSAGNVSSFEPTKIGRGMGIPTQWEANGFESYVESPQDYLNRHKQFQERLKAENRVK